MTRILMLATLAVVFATGAHAGDGKDRIDRRDGISTLDHHAPVLREGRSSAEDKYKSSWVQTDPRREDDR